MADTWSAEIRGAGDTLLIQSPHLRVLEGDLSTEFGATLEKLQTPGVDSYRIRERSREMKDLRIELMEDVKVTVGIYQKEAGYRQLEGVRVTLTVSILGVRVRWKDVFVEEVQVVSRDGPLFGRGAFGVSRHTLVTAWTLWRQSAGDLLE